MQLRILIGGITTVLGLSACSGLQQKPLENSETLASVARVSESVEQTQLLLHKNGESLDRLQQNQLDQAGQLSQLASTVAKLEQNTKVLLASESLNRTASEPVDKTPATEPQDKTVLGRVEWLWFVEQHRYFAAQIDTVLELSVIFSDNLMSFERDGKKWLRFTVERNDWASEFEAPVKRSEKINTFGGASLKGSVIVLPISLASHQDAIEFLVVQKKRDYPQVVLAKNFLTDVAVVDVAKKYTTKQRAAYLQLEAAARKLDRAVSKTTEAETN